jgi:hypothetical protein
MNAAGILKMNPLNTIKKAVQPIGTAWKSLGTQQKAIVGAGAAGIGAAGFAARPTGGNTTMNKISEYTNPLMDKLAAKRKTHPVSEHQRRWAFAAEERGELPKGKAHKWSKRVKGKDLPAKISADEVANNAFIDELNKLASEKGLKKLIKKIHSTHPEAFKELIKKSGLSTTLLGSMIGGASGNVNDYLINKRLKELGEHKEVAESIKFEKKHPVISTAITAIPAVVGGIAGYKFGKRFKI